MERQLDGSVLAYNVDADDRIISFNQAWDTFARQNDSGHLTAKGDMLKRELWHFISDEETRHLYRLILSRVRGGKNIMFQLRCDSPVRRRLVELRIERVQDGEVRFQSQVLREEQRDYVALLDTTQSRSYDVLSICSWCKRVQVPGSGWHEVEQAIELLELPKGDEPPQLSHICCYECYRKIVEIL